MKKYVWLVAGTVLVIGAILLIRNGMTPQTAAVELVTVNTGSVRQTIDCVGKVQTASNSEVYVKSPCVAQEIRVREGQTVQAGEVLFTVDVDATKQVLSQFGGGVSINTPSTVTAPVSGTVTTLNVRQGEVATGAEPCAVIASGDTVHIAVMIREKYVSRVAVGQVVEITGVAFAKDVYHGTISHIADTAHQEYLGTMSETVVDAVVTLKEDEIDASLRAGLNARASVVVNVIENALLVPYTCIAQDDEGAEYIYVYKGDGTAERQTPTFGEECGDGVLVVSGLAPGAQVVQDPEVLSGRVVAVQVE